jgi:hypothetical protein
MCNKSHDGSVGTARGHGPDDWGLLYDRGKRTLCVVASLSYYSFVSLLADKVNG